MALFLQGTGDLLAKRRSADCRVESTYLCLSCSLSQGEEVVLHLVTEIGRLAWTANKWPSWMLVL